MRGWIMFLGILSRSAAAKHSPGKKGTEKVESKLRDGSVMRVTAALSVTIFSFCLDLVPQAPVPKPPVTDRAVNFPSAPVRLVTYPNGYAIYNLTEKRIVAYALGCAKDTRGSLKITYALALEEHGVPPASSMGTGTIDEVEPAIMECVNKRKAKIAVIEARFADGTVWRWKK